MTARFESPLQSQDSVIPAFGGAVVTRLIHSPHSNLAFAFDVTFSRDLWPTQFLTRKPPLHFHPFQEEYIQVLEGNLYVEVDGKEQLLGPSDEKFCVKPWAHHRLYPPSDFGGEPLIRFLLSGQETGEVFKLDTIFFQNWYGYQDETILVGKPIDPIQMLCMFDSGGSYPSLPWWVPFGRTISKAMTIMLGRWIGGALGYQPYYRKWTWDWELACEKMEMSLFQKRFADRSKTK